MFVERPVLSSVSSAPYELFAGLTAGVGLVNLSLLDHSAKDFEDAVRTPSATFLSRWFFTVQPQLSVGVRLIIPLRLTAGYRLTFDTGAWDQEGRALKGPPQHFNGWTVQLMVGP